MIHSFDIKRASFDLAATVEVARALAPVEGKEGVSVALRWVARGRGQATKWFPIARGHKHEAQVLMAQASGGLIGSIDGRAAVIVPPERWNVKQVLERLAEDDVSIGASTWRSYVARNQAPQPIERGRWSSLDVERWLLRRPGQGARTDLPRAPKVLASSDPDSKDETTAPPAEPTGAKQGEPA